MEEQPPSRVADAWTLVLVSVPVALALWACAFVAAGFGRGTWALFLLFYAPLALLAPKAAVAGGIALHLAYAACCDLTRRGRVAGWWVVGLAAFHYACVAVAERADAPLERALGRGGFWLAGATVLFLAWQVLLAVLTLGRPAPRARP
jgi:hypothetical protein